MKSAILLALGVVLCFAGNMLAADDGPQAKKADKSPTEENATPEKRSVKHIVPVIKLSGGYKEKPVVDDNPFNFGVDVGESFYSLLNRVNKAKSDTDVPAIVLVLNSPGLNWAQVDELSRALADFKAAGKTIHVHQESLSTHELALASSATEISMVPGGLLHITGLYGEQLFLRGLLDKLGVTPDYLTCGEYKSAAEMFMRTQPSPEAAQMNKWLFDAVYDNLLGMIARGRGVEVAQAGKWIDHGLYTAEDALKQGVIDAVEHKFEFEARLRELYGEELKLDRRYGRKSSNEIDFSSPLGVMRFYAELFSPSKPRRSTKPGVGIVYLEGPILPGNSAGNPWLADSAAFGDVIRKSLEQAADDDAIKAVVFRVNSPGGSAVASEVILDASRRVATKKPLIVSMGGVAASGGYYVACGANTIVAEASTITGSIGVVSGKFATTPMWNKLGVTFTPIRRGKNASLLSSATVFTEDERQVMQDYMDATYSVFKNHVTQARGDLLKKPIDDIAGGRVYTGLQAHEVGLIDRIGGLQDAIALAAEQAQLDDGYDVRVVPRTKGFMEQLMNDMSGGSDDANPHLTFPVNSFSMNPVLQTALPLLNEFDPARITAVKQALLQLSVLQTEHVSLFMPALTLGD